MESKGFDGQETYIDHGPRFDAWNLKARRYESAKAPRRPRKPDPTESETAVEARRL